MTVDADKFAREFAEALDLDPSRVTRIDMHLLPGKPPDVMVTLLPLEGDKTLRVFEYYKLVPRDE